MSIIFLIVAACLCYIEYKVQGFFRTKTISIKPDFLSGTAAIAMLLPLYARGILKWSKSIYGLIMLVLLWTVYSSIIQMALNGKSNIPEYMIASATLLSWLGIRGVAGFAWVIAFSACILSLITSNAAMGGLGFLFLVTASSAMSCTPALARPSSCMRSDKSFTAFPMSRCSESPRT
ncbi:hypothetical protein [Paracoccus aminovorans]|uniref:hypothetical protein n=1 Tax=Paracoccus aminovorans TaxID=34004 RepID=UPI0009450040|nr:hypothetical protein [Paracoccus aminovorans]